ncbi:hypothetical protein [Streptomyces sp. NPDC058621]
MARPDWPGPAKLRVFGRDEGDGGVNGRRQRIRLFACGLVSG